jgi:hypothetical protein
MFAFLRRHQPRHPLLGVVYWAVLTASAVAILFLLFFLFDTVFGLAPFDQPGL